MAKAVGGRGVRGKVGGSGGDGGGERGGLRSVLTPLGLGGRVNGGISEAESWG